MPDPWLTKEGKLHPAAAKMGLPEWKEGVHKRLHYNPTPAPPFSGYKWSIQRHSRTEGWVHGGYGYTGPHEAAALLEKAAREWLWERHMTVAPQWSPAIRKEPFWIVYNAAGQPLLVDGGYTEWNNHKYTKFGTHIAALQAGILAAKGDDDEHD